MAVPQESLDQQRSLRNLVLRNRDTPLERALILAEGGIGPTPLQLPFIIIQAGHEAQVELQMSDDSTQVQFDFHKCVTFPPFLPLLSVHPSHPATHLNIGLRSSFMPYGVLGRISSLNLLCDNRLIARWMHTCVYI